MMKIYRGRRIAPGPAGDSVIEIVTRTTGGPGTVEVARPLEHRIRHSPSGMNWGYAGSGPADLALSLLWDFTGGPVAPAVYQAFKSLCLAKLHQDNPWELAEDTVQIYLDGIKATLGLACVKCGDRGMIDTAADAAIWIPCDACDRGRERREEILRDLGARP